MPLNELEQEKLLQRLRRPTGKIDVVLDTDAYNEIDDQFAIAYMLKSTDKLNVKALYAAPFHNEKSSGAADGMERSYNELMEILDIMNLEGMKTNTFRGSDRYLASETEPVISPAAEHLAKLAMEYTPEKPLYVTAIGAITNVASAILINPAIVDRIVIVWLGGHSFEWPHTQEFNMCQDVAAARIIFGCGAAVVQLPCMGVVSAFTVSGVEMKHWLLGKNALCDHLVNATLRDMSTEKDESTFCWSRVIWDVTAVAWLLNDGSVLDSLEHSPIPEYDHHYGHDRTRHLIRYVYHIDRDALFQNLVNTLTK